MPAAYSYEPIAAEEGQAPRKARRVQNTVQEVRNRPWTWAALLVLVLVAVALLVGSAFGQRPFKDSSCDTIQRGFQCNPAISHYWGQYSPYFAAPSDISDEIPHGCSITFAQMLSRHGARDPTASKTAAYRATIQQIHANVDTYEGAYAFLENYEYTLGADQLTGLGQEQMINSGIKFFERYRDLAEHISPFVRASGQRRVVESAVNWTRGFYEARHETNYDTAPAVIIPEAHGVNNTLSQELCTAFEDGPTSSIGSNARATWENIFVPPIQDRLNTALSGANLSSTQSIYMMDMCPFETVAEPNGKLSPFCSLFSTEEWHQYDYYQSLGKYYGYGPGNPLGPTVGIGFVNELIARLTGNAVVDHTSTNSTLDADPTTFPIGGKHKLFADFSHDNDMIGIFSAFGLYNDTQPLSNTSLETPQQAAGYAASWTVPFGARAYFEKMQCHGEDQELVRVIVNDRVQPLHQCQGDELGRCTLSAFLESLSFARNGGSWASCFT